MISDKIQQTIAFTNFIKQTSTILNLHPEADVILKSSQPYDYETILSIERFLRARGVKNRIFLDFERGSEPVTGLGAMLVDISENGTTKQVWVNDWEYLRGQGDERIQPLRNFNPIGLCFEIYLSGDESDYPTCIQLRK